MSDRPKLSSPTSLSTKVTVIVFWGLIIVGLVFATLLLHNREQETRDAREALADSIAYQLDHLAHNHELEPTETIALLNKQLATRDDIGVSVRIAGQKFVRVGAELGDENPHLLVRTLDLSHDDQSQHSGELTISMPNMDQTLHAERSRLLLTLGALLLIFGVVLKGLLERVLTLPMAQMVRTAYRLSEGQADANFPSERKDEFGYLAKFINRALERVRKSELEAQRSKELAEVTLRSIGDGVITTNHNGRVMFMNPVAERLLQMTLEEVHGQFLPRCDAAGGRRERQPARSSYLGMPA